MPQELVCALIGVSLKQSSWTQSQSVYDNGKTCTQYLGCEHRQPAAGQDKYDKTLVCSARLKLVQDIATGYLRLYKPNYFKHRNHYKEEFFDDADRPRGLPRVMRQPLINALKDGRPITRADDARAILQEKKVTYDEDFLLNVKNRRQLMSFIRIARRRIKHNDLANNIGGLRSLVASYVDGTTPAKLTEYFRQLQSQDSARRHDLIVLYSKIEVIEETDPKTGKKTRKFEIVVILTTANFLCNLTRQFKLELGISICADGTRRVNTEGFPLIPCGTTCIGQHFHYLSLTMAHTEDNAIYTTMFSTTFDARVASLRWY